MKIGVLGLGARGQSLIKNAILPALQEYNMEMLQYTILMQTVSSELPNSSSKRQENTR